ncbi:anti-sigma factor domain-containing protein [Microbacterium sp. 179-I 3D4 NHS]|uniref:anti-sigma factor n=1 Tax=Microbacterium sp. 179-I 3D4 NHS TaxID=3142381 RepID=UPI0039A1E956
MNEQEFAELAAGAALHALSPDEERRFRRALVEHPEWQALVDADAETAARLADAAPAVVPAPDLRASLLARIATTPQDDDPTPDAAPDHAAADLDAGARHPLPDASAPSQPAASPARPRRWSRAVFALAACLALLVGVGVAAVAINQSLNRPASVVALEMIESSDDAAQASITLDDGTTATAHWSASLGSAVLVAEGLDAPAEGKTYEMWFVRGETPVSAGVFDVEGGQATALLSGDMHEGDVIAVTVEQDGGSPDGQPTTDPIIVIPTA